SSLELKVDGHRTVVLSSSTEKSFASQIELTTGNINLRDSFELPENTVHIRRDQLLSGNVLFDHFTFENFNLQAVEFRVELNYAADFVDVFQVRGVARGTCGTYFEPQVSKDTLIFVYRGKDDVWRKTEIKFSTPPRRVEGTTAMWDVRLERMKGLRIETTIRALVHGG